MRSVIRTIAASTVFALALGTSPAWSASEEPIDAGYTLLLAEAHESFVAMERARYRLTVFALLAEIVTLSGTEIVGRLVDVVAYAENGGDGLETLIVSYVHALDQRGDTAALGDAEFVLASAGGSLPYVVARPNAYMVTPLGGSLAPVSVGVRPGVARILADAYLADANGGLGLLPLVDLLGEPGVSGDVCALAALGTHDRGAPLEEQLQALDDRRQQACDESGRPGTAIDGAYEPLVNLAADDCLQVMGTAGQQIRDSLGRLDECVESLSGVSDPQTARVPMTGPGAVVPIRRIIAEAAAEKAAEEAVGAAAEKAGEAITPKEGGLWDFIVDEIKRAFTADRDIAGLEGEIAALNKSLDKLASLNREYQERGDTEAQQNTYDEWWKTYKLKLEKEQELARKKAEEASDSLDPTLDEACLELATGGVDLDDPAVVRQLDESWRDTLWRVTANKDRPADTDAAGDASDLLGASECGADPYTTSLVDAKRCGAFDSCEPGEPHCGCPERIDPESPNEEATLMGFLLAVDSCATWNCPDGKIPVPSGMICDCQDRGEEEEPTGPSPRPVPTAFTSGTVFLRSSVGTSEPNSPVDQAIRSYLSSVTGR